MAKAKSSVQETHTKVMNGVLDVNEEGIFLQTEDLGNKDFREMFAKFNGENVSVTIKKVKVDNVPAE